MDFNLPHVTSCTVEITLPPLPEKLRETCIYTPLPESVLEEINLENLCVYAWSNENPKPFLISRFAGFYMGKVNGNFLHIVNELDNIKSKPVYLDDIRQIIKKGLPLTRHFSLPRKFFDEPNEWRQNRFTNVKHCIPNKPVNAQYNLTKCIISENKLDDEDIQLIKKIKPTGRLIFTTEDRTYQIVPINFEFKEYTEEDKLRDKKNYEIHNKLAMFGLYPPVSINGSAVKY